MKVYPILLGDFDVTEKVLFRNGDIKKTVVFSSYSFYIDTGKEKLIVDTGFGDYDFSVRKLGRPIRTTPELSLESHFKRLGVSPDEISTLILTHCHWDHIGSLNYFKNAKILCQASEMPWIMSPPEWIAESYSPAFTQFIVEAKDRMIMLSGDYSVCNGIDLVRVGGHSPGSMIVKLTGSKKNIIITGDALYYYDNYYKNIPNGECFCLYEAMDTLNYFKKCMNGRTDTVLMPAHDPTLWEKYKGGYEEC